MSHLELLQVSKTFDNVAAVRNLNLSVERGEILSILGPSGCGKTTTLRMIAGLEEPDSGKIMCAGRDITREPARNRNIGMVFQNYALFPHLNVFENVAFGLRTRGIGQGQIEQRVQKALGSVKLEGFERRQAHQLSGGQQQRIALARALAIEPDVLLLDEPLSNLDPSLREELRDQIRAVIRQTNVTTVFVTHDQQEAFALADRLVILNAGQCRQAGPPRDVYNNPVDAFVARFLGKANMVPSANGETLFVRPEDVILGDNGFPATVRRVVFEGSSVVYSLEAGGASFLSRQFHQGRNLFQEGETVRVMFARSLAMTGE